MSSLIITAVNDTLLDADNDDARRVKVEAVGPDVQTPTQLAPYGIDSVPIKDVRAAMANSSVNGEPFLLGVINTDNKAEPGEFRAFATNADGALKLYIWIKADGTLLLGGDMDNAVRYKPLETAYNQLKSDHDDIVTDVNSLKTALAALQTAVAAVPAPLTGTALGALIATALATYYGQPVMPSTGDITPAKIDEIKTL